ncbi:hypothetical protein BDB01DRAFT_347763 [Pilobolus umbonatus]|nr:hypothetical protein BDB01DRAFT_347763 [Pilobolus umbonatus]
MTNKKRKREVERKKPVIKKKKVEVRIEDVSGEISYSSGLVYEKQTATTSMVDSSGDTVMTEITSVGELNVEQNERQSMERIVTESVVRENEKNSESVMEEEIPIREGNNGKESIDDAVEGQDKQELVDNTWGTLSTSNEDSSFSDDEEDNINEVEYLEKTIAQTYHNEPDELEEEEEEEEESRALLTDKQVEQTEQSNKSEQLDKEGERTEPRNKEGESLEQTITEGEPLEKPEEGNKSAKSPRNRRVQKVRRIAKEDDKDDEEEAEKRRRTSLKELKNAEIYNAILSDRSQRQSYPLPSERKPRRPQKRRKEAVPWTAEEVEALEVGILSYKGPYWASIRDFVKPRLDNRTNVQIKDKARNELKKRQRENLPLDCYGCLLRSGDSPKS